MANFAIMTSRDVATIIGVTLLSLLIFLVLLLVPLWFLVGG